MYIVCVCVRARAHAFAHVCVDVNVAKLLYWLLVRTVWSWDVGLVCTSERETYIFYKWNIGFLLLNITSCHSPLCSARDNLDSCS